MEGHALGKRWIEKISSGECSPNEITLIGHSFGGVVNAVASNDIHEYFEDDPGYGDDGAQVGTQVILDTPWFAQHLIESGSTDRIFNVYGPLSAGVFGSPITAPNVTDVLIDFPGHGISLPDLGHTKLVDEVWPQIRDEVLGLQPGNYYERRISGTQSFRA